MAKSLIDLAQLTALVKQPAGSLDEDPYTAVIMMSAEAVVKDEAGHPEWVGGEPGEGEVIAPARAGIIALWLAKRAWEDPGNRQRRTAGPISTTWFEGGVKGLDLKPDEAGWLADQNPGGNSGLWVLRMAGNRPFAAPAETPDGYSFSAGDLNFAHGMDVSGRPWKGK